MDPKSQKIIDETNAMLDRITEDLKAAYPHCHGPELVAGKYDVRMWFLSVSEIAIDLKEIQKWIEDGFSWQRIRLEVYDRIRSFLDRAVNEYLEHIKGTEPSAKGNVMDYRNHPKGLPEHLADILTMLDEMFEPFPWIGEREHNPGFANTDYSWKISLGGYESAFAACQGEFNEWIRNEVTPEQMKAHIWERVHCALSDIYELHITP